MVAILQEHGIAYFGIPKSASTSIKLGLYELLHGEPWHGPTMRIHPQFPIVPVTDEDFDRARDMWSFTVVRDPVKRVLSAFQNRVHDHRDLHRAFRKSWRARASSLSKGLKAEPSFEEFLDRYDAYCDASYSMLHHTRSVTAFIGTDLSFFDAVFTPADLPKLKTELEARTGRTVNFPRENSTGKSLKFEDISPKAQRQLLEFTAADYGLLSDYFHAPSLERA